MIYNITSIKEEYKEKEHKIADELNKSKEELNFKNQQIEVTEKILKESRDLLGKRKELNDQHAKSLYKLLQKLEVKQHERSQERSRVNIGSSLISPSPVKPKSRMPRHDHIQKPQNKGQFSFKNLSNCGSIIDEKIEPTGKENITKMDIKEL